MRTPPPELVRVLAAREVARTHLTANDNLPPPLTTEQAALLACLLLGKGKP